MTGAEWLTQHGEGSIGAGPTLHDPIVITGRTNRGRLVIAQTCRVDAFTKLNIGEGITLEDHVHIASFCDVNVGGGGLHIGKGSTLSSHVILATGESIIRDGKSGSAQSPDFQKGVGMLFIGEHVTIFAGAIVRVRPNTTLHIGNGAVVGAGALVLRDVAPYTMVLGSPARARKDLARG